MLMVISPAKTLDFESPLATQRFTQSTLLEKSQQLIDVARDLSPAQISSLMSISDKLAHLNADRFNQWQPPFTLENARQAILAFKGGVLRPLDLMQPYRLEMGIKLANPAAKDLYGFWGDLLTQKLNEAMAEQGDEVLINLASDEYFKAVKPKQLNGELIKPVFLDEKNGKFKVISFYAKKARGLMSRYVIQNRLSKPEQLKQFDVDGYFFAADESKGNELVFKRYEQK
jgi:uncharacterized protein